MEVVFPMKTACDCVDCQRHHVETEPDNNADSTYTWPGAKVTSPCVTGSCTVHCLHRQRHPHSSKGVGLISTDENTGISP